MITNGEGRRRAEVIAVLEEMLAEVELAQGQAKHDRKQIEKIQQRLRRMRELHQEEIDLIRRSHRAY